MTKSVRKDNCMVCGEQLLEDIILIGEQYPSAIYPKVGSDYRAEIHKASLDVSKCSNPDCGLVQLSHTYNLDYVFENYPFVSGTTATMNNILADVVKEVEGAVQLTGDDVVLDIGGNDGTLLSLLTQNVKAKVNIDAAHGIQSVMDEGNYRRIEAKFSADVYKQLDLPAPKAITSVAMFYHLSDPLSFCKEVNRIMTDETVWVLQMTYLGSMLDSNIYDNIVHEHVAYYSLESLTLLMDKAGLEIIDAKVVSSYGGSIRVNVRRKKASGSPEPSTQSYLAVKAYEKKNGVNTVEALRRFNERIGLLKKFTQEMVFHLIDRYGKMVALGASTKGNMMCQLLGFDQSHFSCALDNNEKKIGLAMTGSDIPVVDEQEYLSNVPEYLFVLPYYYMDFFKSMIASKLSGSQCCYLVAPLPEPHFIKLTGAPKM